MEDDKNCIQDARGPWHKQAFSKSSVLINSKIVATHSDIRSLSFHFDTGPLLNLIINRCLQGFVPALVLALATSRPGLPWSRFPAMCSPVYSTRLIEKVLRDGQKPASIFPQPILVLMVQVPTLAAGDAEGESV